MNRLIGRYPLTSAYLAAVAWISFVVSMTSRLR